MEATFKIDDCSSGEEEKEPASKQRYSPLLEMDAMLEVDDCSSKEEEPVPKKQRYAMVCNVTDLVPGKLAT